MKKRKIVIALGGNALGKNVEEQQEAVEHTAKVIVDLEQQGYDLIITHGNGPQVGMIQSAMNEYAAAHSEAEVPLSTSVAMSQGYIGFDLQNAIKDELYLRGIDHKVSTIRRGDKKRSERHSLCGGFGKRLPAGGGVTETETDPGASDHPYFSKRRAYRGDLWRWRNPGGAERREAGRRERCDR